MCVSARISSAGYLAIPSACMRSTPYSQHAQPRVNKESTSDNIANEVLSSSISPVTSCQTKDKLFHPIIVQHTYQDHSNDQIFQASSADLRKNRGGVAAPFPLKLHDMLTSVDKEGYDDIVSWQPHGRCFKIHKPEEFKTAILPRYFPNLSKMASFQRQLNLYGFKRLAKHESMDRAAYYHELFLRGRSDLVNKIQRTKVKGTGIRARSNPEQEPDFWSMSWVNSNKKDNLVAPSLGTTKERQSAKKDFRKIQTAEPIQVVSRPNASETPFAVSPQPCEFSFRVIEPVPQPHEFYYGENHPKTFQKPALFHPVFSHAPLAPVSREVSSSIRADEEMDVQNQGWSKTFPRRNSMCARRNSLYEQNYSNDHPFGLAAPDGNAFSEDDVELRDFDFDQVVSDMFNQHDENTDFETLLQNAIL